MYPSVVIAMYAFMTPLPPLMYPPCIVAPMRTNPLVIDEETNTPGEDDGRKRLHVTVVPDCVHVGGINVKDETPYLKGCENTRGNTIKG